MLEKFECLNGREVLANVGLKHAFKLCAAHEAAPVENLPREGLPCLGPPARQEGQGCIRIPRLSFYLMERVVEEREFIFLVAGMSGANLSLAALCNFTNASRHDFLSFDQLLED